MILCLTKPVGDLPAGRFVVADECGNIEWDNGSRYRPPAESFVLLPATNDLLIRHRSRDVSRDLCDVVNGYLTAALWAETDSRYADGEEVDGDDYHDSPFDKWAGLSDCSDALVCDALNVCSRFIEMNRDDFDAYCGPDGRQSNSGEYSDAECFGHDLWLTRGHHGAGFWDRGLGELGERLTKAAHRLGECYIYSVPIAGAEDDVENREVTL